MIDIFSAVFLHLDHTLPLIFAEYGLATCGILFLVIFCETGLVFLPFLPGDSLLFAAGVLAAQASWSLFGLWALLALAAIAGDNLNYVIGSLFGKRLIEKTRFIQPIHLEKSKAYFESKGQKAIILARFIPIFRTFVPFLAGMTHMSYKKFSQFNIIGGLVWTGGFLFSGYYFANVPLVKDHFSTVILAIMGISLLPPAWDFGKAILGRVRK